MVAGQIDPAMQRPLRRALAARVRATSSACSTTSRDLLHVERSVDVLDLRAGVGGAIFRRGYWGCRPWCVSQSWVGGVTMDFTGAECAAPVDAVELATGLCSRCSCCPRAPRPTSTT